MKSRMLTKSRFKLALECPAKLFYDGKPEYANQKLDDPFLQALADGGFQVGALAKCYYGGGSEVLAWEHGSALEETKNLLEQESVIIYEAAVCFETLFTRIDILVKRGNEIDLIEVKAKSLDREEDDFLTKGGNISATWYPYLADAAFQKYVLRCALPDYSISAYLMLADKASRCSVDGLNQKFKLTRDNLGTTRVIVPANLTSEDLGSPILTPVNVDEYCDFIYSQKFELLSGIYDFPGYLDLLASSYANDNKICVAPSAECKKCQFITTEADDKAGLKSGFRECFSQFYNWGEVDFKEPTVLEIWNYRKTGKLLEEGRVKIAQVEESDINPKDDGKPGLSSSQRQWLQISKAQNRDTDYWIDIDNMVREIQRWKYPLHFIDFETSSVAIPFNKGRHPYEGIAFQYSHHIVNKDGSIEHRGQYLNTEAGLFPNYKFVRALKRELEQDGGTILRYAAHENTFLITIYRQLIEETQVEDGDALCEFIRRITKCGSRNGDNWEGERNMIDMCELVKRYYYDPATKGSNSIKQVLPAIMNSSKFLQDKYSAPVYGSSRGIPSLNFRDWRWITYEDNRIVDPYKLLPKLFQEDESQELSLLSTNDEIKEGGAATTAYALMQFTEMSDYERAQITSALYKYCELDTFAMVMIYEAWKDMVSSELIF
ncbi:MAG: DUF2779 domain-containing protein [Dehalococcoidales bacterium]|nr:DUF2779 domain-containing protein [Dehalococcoidales bacterium]